MNVNSKSHPEVIIWYMGTKGSGNLLLKKIQNLLNSENFETAILDKQNLYEVFPILRRVKHLKVLFLIPTIRKRAIQSIARNYIRNETKVVVVVMSSAVDLGMEETLPGYIKVIRIIHDHERHEGDLWPTNRAIRKMLQSATPFTLSKFVSEEIYKRYKVQSLSSAHPLIESSGIVRKQTPPLNGKYLLVIGRLKKYQNLKKTLSFWKENVMPSEHFEDFKLIIAGKGSLLTYLRRRRVDRVEWIRKWLSDEEFFSLVSNASAVLCLYSGASQSGIISICQSLGTPFVTTNVGGLPEQASYGGGIVVDAESVFSWHQGVLDAISGHFSPSNNMPDIIFQRNLTEIILSYLNERSCSDDKKL